MKLSEILLLDCSKKENRKMLRLSLKKLSLLEGITKEWHELNTDDLEKVVKKVSQEYPIKIGYIWPANGDMNYLSFMIKSSETHEMLKTVFSLTLFEGYAKSLFFMYGFMQKQQKEDEGTK